MHPELTDIGDRFDTKVAAIACYDSQVATIYGDHETMRRELAACCAAARRGAKHERYWLPRGGNKSHRFVVNSLPCYTNV